MNFLLSEQQMEVQETVRRLVGQRCDSARLHQLFDSASEFDAKLWKSLCEVGVAGLNIPEQFGGVGLEAIDLALVAEVLGSAAAPTPVLGHWLAALAILLAGSGEQKARWLPLFASGEAIGTLAFAEGDAHWQPEEWAMRSSGVLTGKKCFVTGTEEAALFVVGTSWGGLALVERGAPGMSVMPVDGVDRTRRFATVEFLETPCSALPDGAAYSARVRDTALVLIAADAFGGASRCVDMAMSYAKAREQFGVPIGRFQGLKHQLANMAAAVEPARGLVWFAAHALDHVKDAAPRAAALAKAHLTDRYLQAARDTIEAHGGVGYTWQFDAQIFLKRAMFDHAYLGSPFVHRNRSAALAGW